MNCNFYNFNQNTDSEYLDGDLLATDISEHSECDGECALE